jgi:hypothetical protein
VLFIPNGAAFSTFATLPAMEARPRLAAGRAFLTVIPSMTENATESHASSSLSSIVEESVPAEIAESKKTYHAKESNATRKTVLKSSAYYMEPGLSMKKKMHDNYPLLRTCLMVDKKHVNRRDNRHA